MTASRLLRRAVEMYLTQHMPGWRLADVAPEVVAQEGGQRGRLAICFIIERVGAPVDREHLRRR